MSIIHNVLLLGMKTANGLIPKKDNKILFYSKPDFSDNSRAIYEYMTGHGLDKKYEIVWMINNQNNALVKLHPEISYVSRKSVKGFLEFATSRYVFRSHMLFGNVRSKKQIVTLLWHGMGIKGDVDYDVSRNCVDYVSVTSDLYRFKLATRVNCSPSRAMITGLPRNDFMFQNRYMDCLNSLPKFRENPDAKTILWMPTYHANNTSGDKHGKYYEMGIPVVTGEQLPLLNDLLKELNILLLIKLHPHMIGEGEINKTDYSNIQIFDDSFLPSDCSLYHLLGGVDAMLTDYSSVYTDFMLLDRPIGFIYDDFEEYSKKPGFAFERVKLMMPGQHILDLDGLFSFIRGIADGEDNYREERQHLNKMINFYCDGNSCERVLKHIGIINDK